MKDYYKILHVEKNADHETIRQSYRTLAKKFHPDINSSPQAHITFTEINEAYTVLSDKNKRANYDAKLVNPFSQIYEQYRSSGTTVKPEKSMNEIIREARMRSDEAKKKYSEAEKRYYKKYKPRSQKVLFALLLFNILVFTDYFLPREFVNEIVMSRDYKVRTKSANFPIDGSIYLKSLRKGALVNIERSPVFKQNFSITFRAFEEEICLPATYSIFKGFTFAPIMVLICCILGLYIKKDYYFIYSLAMVSSMIWVLELFFLYYSI